MSATEEQIRTIIQLSKNAKDNTYCPYSKFRVGSALLCEDGTIFTGVNVENASHGLTICAERTAICKAVSEGYRRFIAIAISSDLAKSYIVPCGACRQFLCEFGTEWSVYMTKPDLTYKKSSVGELLPHCFTPDTLHEDLISTGIKAVETETMNGKEDIVRNGLDA